MATLYVDYKNGNDAGDGSSGSPLKTLAHCFASHANNGDTILLRGTSATDEIHRVSAGVSTSKTGLIVAADTGHTPVVSGSTAYSSWSLTGGQSFTYETAYTTAGCYMVWNDATWFTKKANVGEVEATENTFYFDDAGNLLYVHIAGGGMPGTLEVSYANVNLTFSGADCTIRNLTIEHGLSNIELTGANAVVDACRLLNPCHPSTNSSTGASLKSSGQVVKNCYIENYIGVGLQIYTGASSATVRACTIVCTDLAVDPIIVKYGVFVRVGTGHVIEDCTIRGWLDGVYAQTATGVMVRRCTMIDCWHAFAIWESDSPVVAHHNTCYFTRDLGNTAATHGFVLHNYGTNQVHHNVFAYMDRNTGATPHNCGFHVAPMSGTQVLYASNNVFYDCGIGIDNVSGTVEWHLSNNAFYETTTNFDNIAGGDQGTGNVTTDPMFVNPGNYDFRLLPSSPLIDAGLAVTGINEGFRGGAPDIGAFEYVRPVRHGRR